MNLAGNWFAFVFANGYFYFTRANWRARLR
jgi:hypothetical protein